jgi:hypothetical protein
MPMWKYILGKYIGFSAVFVLLYACNYLNTKRQKDKNDDNGI